MLSPQRVTPRRSNSSPKQSSRLLLASLDVTDRPSIDEAVQAAAERFGPPDVLVNNAGYGLLGPLEGLDQQSLFDQFDTNVFGLVAVTQAILPLMRTRKRGVVINISSIGGRIAFPFASANHATKFAVEGLTESMRFDLAAHGIRVKLVEPGGIKTRFNQSNLWLTHPAHEPASSEFRRMSEGLDANLPGPEKVAGVVYRAATDASQRLRYPAAPGPYLLMRSPMPDALWRGLVSTSLRQHARARSEAVRA
jgi:NAD(P)-dependent dehydrogenase (short-subunit alcohol dehydrogenase family)